MDNKKVKVLIGDDSTEYGIACANELRALGLYVVTRRRDGRVILDAIRNDMPDVVSHGCRFAKSGCAGNFVEIQRTGAQTAFYHHFVL